MDIKYNESHEHALRLLVMLGAQLIEHDDDAQSQELVEFAKEWLTRAHA